MIITPSPKIIFVPFLICSISMEMEQIDEYFGKSVPKDFWKKYNHYMLAEMLYAFTVGVNMEEEREETLHMFDDEVERIKHKGTLIPKWFQKAF